MTMPANPLQPLYKISKVLVILSLSMLITLAIFLFMQNLIHADNDAVETVELAAFVDLYREQPKPKTLEPEPEPEPISEVKEEPKMDTLQAVSVEPVAQVDQAMPSVDMGSLSINVGSSAGDWAMPVTGQGLGVFDEGKDSQGYVEITPYTTRRPNIPKLAWENKLNGWVLVAFTVDKSGYTRNILMLDANPKGIFEEEVKRAVGLWRYNVSAIKGYSGDMILTQKVSLYWKHYPDNVAYQ
ncbi:energy transducer TonB [Alkalimarinus alittae]|uniref:Protein TonB n=1 Tax=Alkalimarinus alittae TaxID=2961619 RepID=A0ABY6N290_9ALTE|nr:energy transducer TonB [Alkalimarinus alittae]UZE96230.1 energy transducer TonB [Alkalimarinus alittae]